MFWRTLSVVCACGLLAASALPACGGNASDANLSAAGGGGSGARAGAGSSGNGAVGRAGTAGVPTEATPVPCGSKSCTGVVIPIQSFPIPACCADAATGHCGLDSSVLSMFGPTFTEACQPLAQPGTADETCPKSPSAPFEGTGLSISFPGCCRADHSCGYQLDTIGGAFRLGLGCVDATPFLGGSAPQACGEAGAAGAGGDSAAVAGAGGDSSGAGAGGVPGAGGDSVSGGTAG
ncbi:MAG: hypothetical protein WDO74_33540 [Pseudomonadota bacterium]